MKKILTATAAFLMSAQASAALDAYAVGSADATAAGGAVYDLFRINTDTGVVSTLMQDLFDGATSIANVKSSYDQASKTLVLQYSQSTLPATEYTSYVVTIDVKAKTISDPVELSGVGPNFLVDHFNVDFSSQCPGTIWASNVFPGAMGQALGATAIVGFPNGDPSSFSGFGNCGCNPDHVTPDRYSECDFAYRVD